MAEEKDLTAVAAGAGLKFDRGGKNNDGSAPAGAASAAPRVLATPDGFRVGGRDVGYVFDFNKSGVYLTVFPSDDDSHLFALTDMQKILDQYKVKDYNIVRLTKVVRKASGQLEKIAELFKGDENSETPGIMRHGNVNDERPVAKYRIEVAKDKYSAKLKFDDNDTKYFRLPDVEDVLKDLSNLGIVYGFDKEQIQKDLLLGLDFVVAKGHEPVKGEDARIECYYNMETKGRAAIDKDDRADFKNMNMFIAAKKGQLLAKRIPHTVGVPGKNVYGTEIPAKSGKPKPVPMGKNTYVENENEIYASIDGQVVEKNSKITIDPSFYVQGDVGVGTGNIDFIGSVTVSGNVELGFSVKATGDIKIDGFVAGGTVEGNNVAISGGVLGMDNGRIKAVENIIVSFTENAVLDAGNDILVSDAVLHSTLTAGHKVKVLGKRGMIVGGNIQAGEEIEAKTIGNAANVVTRVSVGQNPALLREYKQACQEYSEAKERMDDLQKKLATLSKIDKAALSSDKAEMFSKLTRSQFPLAGEIDKIQKKIARLDESLQKMEKGKIRVAETIHAGVRMTINKIVKNFLSEQSCCTLSVKEDAVATSPY